MTKKPQSLRGRFCGKGSAAIANSAIFKLILLFYLSFPVFAAEENNSSEGWALRPHSPGELSVLTRLRGVGFGDKPRLYIRLFKVERLLEVWIRKGGSYKLYQSFDICKYSGEVGPKLKEGDGQAPEGFYHIPVEEIFWRSRRWPEALNLAFPNVFDAQNRRTGSYLLIHGGCSSKGCFALENGPMAQLFALVRLAARGGQKVFPIHIFPFRLTAQRWADYKGHRWAPFWQSLQPAYDYFRRYRNLPEIVACSAGYKVSSLRALDDDAKGVRGACVIPLPLFSLSKASLDLDWVASLPQFYEKLEKSRGQGVPAALTFKIPCNIKRPSCRRWVALKKKRLAREATQ